MPTEAQLESRRAACRKWRANNPGKQAAATKRWAERNPEKLRDLRKRVNEKRTASGYSKAYAKQWRLRNPDSSLRVFRARTGIELSWDALEKLKSKQSGKCAICGRESKLCIDHCHKLNKVRGLLCRKCNAAIGLFNDNFSTILRASEYVRRAEFCIE